MFAARIRAFFAWFTRPERGGAHRLPIPLPERTGVPQVDALERTHAIVTNFRTLGFDVRPWGGTRGVWLPLDDAEQVLAMVADCEHFDGL